MFHVEHSEDTMRKRWLGNTMEALKHLKDLYGDEAPALTIMKPGREPQGIKHGVSEKDRREPERDSESPA
jgi:hypothetical protein